MRRAQRLVHIGPEQAKSAVQSWSCLAAAFPLRIGRLRHGTSPLLSFDFLAVGFRRLGRLGGVRREYYLLYSRLVPDYQMADSLVDWLSAREVGLDRRTEGAEDERHALLAVRPWPLHPGLLCRNGHD